MADNYSKEEIEDMLENITIQNVLKDASLDDMQKKLESFAGTTEEATEEVEKFIDATREAFENQLKEIQVHLKNSKIEDKLNKKMFKKMDSFVEGITEVIKKFKKLGPVMDTDIASKIAWSSQNMRANVGMRDGPSIGGNKKSFRDTMKMGDLDGTNYAKGWSRSIAHSSDSIATVLLGGTDLYAELTKGLPAALLYRREMQMSLYLTEGLTKETKNLAEDFMNVAGTVSQTGYGLSESQKAMALLVKRGVRGASTMMSITKSSLNTAQMMNLSASESLEMTSTFADWNQHLGLSVDQLSSIGSGMKDISRTSGLTGTNLLSAVKASDQFLVSLRKSGQLTASSAKNIMSLTSSLQKRGVLGESGQILDLLTNPSKILLGQGGVLGGLMAGAATSSGTDSQFFSGTLTKSKKDQAAFFGAFEKNLSKMFKVDFSKLDEMNGQQMAIINAQLETAGAPSLAILKQLFDGVKESTMPLASTLEKYNKEIAKNDDLIGKATTTKGKELLQEKKRKIMEEKLTATSAASSSAIDMVLGSIKKGGPNYLKDIGVKAKSGKLDDVPDDLSAVMTEMKEFGLADQVKNGDANAILKATALASAENLKNLTGGETDMKASLMEAIASGNTDNISAILEEVNSLTQAANVDRKKDLNPIDKLVHTINKLNAIIVAKLAKQLEAFITAIDAPGIALLYGGLVALSAAMSLLTTVIVAKATGRLLGMPNGMVGGVLTRGKEITKDVGSGLGGMFEKTTKAIWGTKNTPVSVMGHSTGVGPAGKGILDKLFDFMDKPIKPVETFKKAMTSLGNSIFGVKEVVADTAGIFHETARKGGLLNKAKAIGTSGVNGLERGLVSMSRLIERGAAGGEGMFRTGGAALRRGVGALRVPTLRGIGTSLGNSIFGAKEVVADTAGISKTIRTGGLLNKAKAIGTSALEGLGTAGRFSGNVPRAGANVVRSGFGMAKGAVHSGKFGLTKIPGAAVIFGGLIGGLNGFMNTTKHFSGVMKETDKEAATLSSTIGGALFGALDGILLGIPGLVLSFFGLYDTVEKFFVFTVHSFVTFFKGIWNGIQKGFESWMPNIQEIWGRIQTSFGEIGESFLKIWNSISSIFGGSESKNLEEAFSQIWSVLEPIGEWVGKNIGEVLGATLSKLLTIFEALVIVIKDVVLVVERWIGKLADADKMAKAQAAVVKVQRAEQKEKNKISLAEPVETMSAAQQQDLLKNYKNSILRHESSVNKLQQEIAPLEKDDKKGYLTTSSKKLLAEKRDKLEATQDMLSNSRAQYDRYSKATPTEQAVEDTSKDMRKLTDMASNKKCIYVHDLHAESLLNDLITSMPSQLLPDFMPNAFPEPKLLNDTLFNAVEEKQKLNTAQTGVKTLSDTDYHDKFERETASSKTDAIHPVKDFRKIISVNEEQVEHLQTLHDDMQELINIFRVNGDSGASSLPTDSNISPITSPNFYRWQFGSGNQNPNKDIITTGE